MAQNSRLESLKQKNNAQRLKPEVAQKVGDALGISSAEVIFLSLEESEVVQERARHTFPRRDKLETDRGTYPFVSRSLVGVELSAPLLRGIRGEAFLKLPQYEAVALIRLPVPIVNAGWGSLLAILSDGFSLLDTAVSNMLVVEYDPAEDSDNYVLRFGAWGPSWSKLIRDFPGTE